MRLGGIAIIIVVAIALVTMIAKASYQQGLSECRVQQAELNAEVIQQIVDEVNAENLDVSDPAAVDCRLRELAGIDTDGDCGFVQ